MRGDLYIFNPEHDLCLANGDMNFIPPFSALQFAADCAGLTAWSDGSAEDVCRAETAGSCPDAGTSVCRIIPWGWDAVLKRRLQRMGMPDALLPSDEELSEIRRLSHRTVAAEADRFIVNAIDSPEYCPVRPVIAISEPSDIATAVDEIGEVVLKAPLSGSGKGLRYTRRGELSENDMGWCRNVIARQGCVMVERREKVVQDFAMLFSLSGSGDGSPEVPSPEDCRSDASGSSAAEAHVGDSVKFEGYSLFWNEGGVYRGNILASDSLIRSRLSKMIPAEVLDRTKVAVTEFLAKRFAGRYCGYVGVDMFIYEDDGEVRLDIGTACDADLLSAPSSAGTRRPGRGRFRLAPCVELNVRMTMGLLARRLFDRHLPMESYPDGKYVLTVEHFPDPAHLAQRMAKAVKILSATSPDARYGVGVFDAETSAVTVREFDF